MRRKIVVGNWKMNLAFSDAQLLASQIVTGVTGLARSADVGICPPFVYLREVAAALRGSTVLLGAQNLYFEARGAFTGEVSPHMIAETGARLAIIGHSERRHTIGRGEDDWMINQKVRAARAAGLTPILCVGETLAQRDAEQTLTVLSFQIAAGTAGFSVSSADDLIVAYEPVWAIGTGRNATPAQAQNAHAHLRGCLRAVYGNVADEIRILYGGSVAPQNASELFAQPDVDGGLIGGASLKADSFLAIVSAALAAGAQ